MLKLTTIRIKEDTYDVHVDTLGRFSAYFQDTPHEERNYTTAIASTDKLDTLVEKVRAATRAHKVKVSIPIVVLEGKTLRKAVATGIHAGNKRVMVRYLDTNTSDTLRTSGDALRELTPEEWDRLTALGTRLETLEGAYAKAKSAHYDEVSKYRLKRGFSQPDPLGQLIREAQEKLTAQEEGKTESVG